MIEINNKKLSHFPRFLMILSLPLGLFLSLLLAYINIIPLKVEFHSIIINFSILVIFMFFISHNAWYSFSIFRNSINELIEEIDNHLLENELIIAGKKKSYGKIDSFFDNYVNNIRNDNFSSIASSIFPTLGILGTFTAIAISMPNFTVESNAALENEITILLSGVGTAFYASIYGIFLSIWWIFFEKRGMTKIENDIVELKNEYKPLLWNKEEIQLYKIIDSQEQNKKFLEKIENVITPEYIHKLDSIAKAKLELIEKIDEEFKHSEQRLSKNHLALANFMEVTSKKQNTILDDFAKLHDSILKTNEALDNSITQQANNSKAIRNETYAVLSSLELVSSDLKSLGKNLIEHDIKSN